jgi:hypothetical protein
MHCGRLHRRFPDHWIPQEIQLHAQSVARDLLVQRRKVKWAEVFGRLSASDQKHLRARHPYGDTLSKWGFKQIQKARSGVATIAQHAQ